MSTLSPTDRLTAISGAVRILVYALEDGPWNYSPGTGLRDSADFRLQSAFEELACLFHRMGDPAGFPPATAAALARLGDTVELRWPETASAAADLVGRYRAFLLATGVEDEAPEGGDNGDNGDKKKKGVPTDPHLIAYMNAVVDEEKKPKSKRRSHRKIAEEIGKKQKLEGDDLRREMGRLKRERSRYLTGK